MLEMWTGLTDAQATILAAIITIVGAGLGVVLGWLLLSGKVNDLEGALDRSKERLEQHEQAVSEKLDVINDQIGAILGGLGQVRGGVEDIQAGASPSAEPPPAPLEEPVAAAAAHALALEDADMRDALKRDWMAIRDRIEAIAASHPDGRTRAKYGRFYRRTYEPLIESLEADGMFDGQAGMFLEANALWRRFQSGRAVPNELEAETMRELRRVLVPGNGD